MRRHLSLLITMLLLGITACKSNRSAKKDASPTQTEAAFWPMKQNDIMRTGFALAPNLIERPEIAWSAEVGVQTRHNSPVVTDSMVFVGSAGDTEGAPDSKDGVYALDLTTGKQAWFSPTPKGDVHGTSWLNGRLVVTGGAQGIWALDARNGQPAWRLDVADTGAAIASPLVLEEQNLAIVGTLSGELLFIDGASGEIRARASLPGEIRAGATSDGTRVFVATTDGVVVAFSLAGEELWRTRHEHRVPGDELEEITTRPSVIVSEPTVADDLLVLAYDREETMDTPPWFALDRKSGALVWEPDALPNFKAWTGLTTSPSFASDLLVFDLPASNTSIGFQTKERRAEFISLTPVCVQQAGPSTLRLPDAIYQVRMDGVFYAKTDIYASVIWYAYLGELSRYPDHPKENKTAPGECHETLPTGRGIASTPAVARDGSVLVGTLEGYLIKLAGPAPEVEEDASEVNTNAAPAPE